MVTRPESYDAILAEMRANDGATLRDTRAKLALDVFQTTAAYDGAIAAWMGAQLEGEGSAQFPAERTLRLQKVQDLRYGENPHQAAAFYRRDGYVNAEHSLAHAKQHQGKELSYNNYLDLDAAWTAVREFDEPACVIVKHLTPCGVCQDDDLVAAYQRAHACDPVSAYGGVMAFNRPVTSDVVVAIFDNKQFVEAIIAPEFAGDALDMYSAKKNARLLSTGGVNPAGGEVEYRSVEGGLLAQDSDAVAEDPATFTVPTKRQPSEEELAELLFAWKVCKSIKSNAIAITKGHATIGVGGGQPNRVNSARMAVEQAGEEAKAGEVVVEAGEVIGSAGVGFLAGCGVVEVPTHRRPRVAIISIGSELVDPTEVPTPGKIRNSNSYALAACAQAAGATPTILPIVEDTLEALAAAVSAAAREYDFVVTSGGASNGDFDFIKPVVEELGELLMTTVNMRPGKAQTFGVVQGTPVFGLPGNPAAAYVGFEMIIRPALRKMQGYRHFTRPVVKAKLSRDVKKNDPRRIFLRSTLYKDDAGEYVVAPAKNQSSGLFGVIQRSNCMAIMPEGLESRTAGSLIDCVLLDVS